MIVNRPEHREYRKEEPISLKWQDSLQKPVKWAYGPKMIYADRPGLVLKERTYRLPTGLSSVIMTIGMMMGLNALFVHAYDLDFRYECVVWRLFECSQILGKHQWFNILGFHLLLVFSIYVIRSFAPPIIIRNRKILRPRKITQLVLCHNCLYDNMWMVKKKLWVHVKVTSNQSQFNT